MDNILNCIKDLFGQEAKSPAGLCWFEHANEPAVYKPDNSGRKTEMRLSELME